MSDNESLRWELDALTDVMYESNEYSYPKARKIEKLLTAELSEVYRRIELFRETTLEMFDKERLVLTGAFWANYRQCIGEEDIALNQRAKIGDGCHGGEPEPFLQELRPLESSTYSTVPESVAQTANALVIGAKWSKKVHVRIVKKKKPVVEDPGTLALDG